MTGAELLAQVCLELDASEASRDFLVSSQNLIGCVLLTPDEAEKVRATIKWLDGSYPASSEPDTVEALALLGGDQGGKRCPVCYSDLCPATLQPGKDGGWVCTHGCGYREDGDQ